MDEINLTEIIEAFPDCINNGTKLKTLLKNLYPNISKAIVNVLGVMTDCGICEEIFKKKFNTLDKVCWQKRLEEDYGFSASIINSCFDLFVQYNSYSTKVVGVTYDGRQHLIEKLLLSDELKIGTRLLLEPDLQNKFDPFALKVLTVRKEVLGYIPKEISKDISLDIKKGRLYAIIVTSILGRDFHEFTNFFNYGIEINITVYKPPIKRDEGQITSYNNIRIGTKLWHTMYGVGVITDLKIEQREKYLTLSFEDNVRTFLGSISLGITLFTLENIPEIDYVMPQKNIDTSGISTLSNYFPHREHSTEYAVDENNSHNETDWTEKYEIDEETDDDFWADIDYDE